MGPAMASPGGLVGMLFSGQEGQGRTQVRSR